MRGKNKVWRSVIALVLTLSMIVPSLSIPARAAGNENLALGKEVSASSSYPGKPWTPDKAVDGDTSGSDSRWSSKRATGTTNEGDSDVGTKEQWMLVDLGEETPIEQINIYWETAFATKYQIQTSLDGTEFTTVKECTATEAGEHTYRSLQVESARYVRIYCLEPKTAKYGYSIYELEVYAQNRMGSAKDVLDSLGGQKPEISEDGTHLVLPEVPEGYEISLFGSDNQQVVTLDGQIITPLVDMDVNLLYKVENTEDAEDVAESEADIKITVPGKYETENGDNEKPNVLPGIREWKGADGVYTRAEDTRLVVSDDSMSGAADVIKTYFDQMLGMDVEIVKDVEPETGDVYLKAGGSVDELGEEGYLLEVDDYVTITSPTVTGMTYGGASVTQILYQDEDMDNIAKGIARDYPKYPIRAGMVDVGRMYIPLEYLEEMTIYMSWFKMNEIQVHINDYWSGSGYSAFRLESETYPQIVAEDGYYTKDDYRQYQKDMKKYGIDVITEIDTPYHAECFRDVPGVKMLEGKMGYLDITTDETREANQKIIENLIDEYLDGDDPVVQSENFHIGTDEYDKAYGEQMRKWTDHFINYVNDKGYKTRLWGSLGKNGFNGTTPVSNEAVMNMWAPYWADVHEMYDAGYDMINTYGGWLYIVPSANAGYPDRLDLKRLYNEFEVNNYKSGRNPSGEAIMPVAHPQTKGAQFCVWNDMTSFKTGFSWFDIFDRFKDGVAIVAEKTWFGEKQDDQTYEEFVERIDALDDKVPNANPGRHVDSEGEVVAEYNFINGGTDSSPNGYDAELHNATVKGGVVTVEKDGYISLPFDSIGYPYTVSMRVKLTDIEENTILFEGEDGVVYANIDGTGKVGFKRGAYRFSFDYEMPEDEWVTLTFVGDETNTTLYVNNRNKGKAKTMDATIGGKTQQSGTSIMTFEKILSNATGSIDSLKIYNEQLQVPGAENIATSAISAEASNNFNDSYTGAKAIDGNLSTRWATKDGISAATLEIEFEKEVSINSTRIVEFKAANNYVTSYNIEYWNGEEWVVGYSVEGLTDQDKASVSGVSNGAEFSADFDTITATRFRLNITEAARPSIYEWELFYYEEETEEPEEPTETLSTAVLEYALTLTDKVSTEGVITSVVERYNDALENAKAVLESAKAGDSAVTQEMVDNAWKELISAMQYLSFKQGDKTDLKKVIDLAEEINANIDKYIDGDAKDAFVETLEMAVGVYNDGDAMQDEVDSTWRALMDAMAKLQIIPDKSNLETLLGKAAALNEADYEATSFSAFRTAFAAAKAVYEDEAATTAEVTAAEISLEDAIAKLTPADGVEKDVVVNAGNTSTNAGTAATADNSSAATSASNTTTEKSAKTGDASPIMLLVVMMAGAALVLAERRKQSRR